MFTYNRADLDLLARDPPASLTREHHLYLAALRKSAITSARDALTVMRPLPAELDRDFTAAGVAVDRPRTALADDFGRQRVFHELQVTHLPSTTRA